MAQVAGQALHRDPWEPRRSTRIVVGLLAGIGATGITAGLGLAGTLVQVDAPIVGPSGLILVTPIALASGYAGAVLRGPAAILAIMAGAFTAPIAAIIAVDRTCGIDPWLGFGLLLASIIALVVAGGAALLGDRVGDLQPFKEHRARGVAILIGGGVAGIVGWLAAGTVLSHCPQPV